MKPVNQSTFGSDQNILDKIGDCFLACLASLLDVELSSVPRDWLHLDSETFHSKYNTWLMDTHGLYVVDLSTDTPEMVLHGYHVIQGRSPRSKHPNVFDHCVVGLNGQMVHDPHPSGDGVEDGGSGLIYSVLVPLTTKGQPLPKFPESPPWVQGFQLGAFSIAPGRMGDDNVSIYHSSGEGGDFSRDALTKVVEQFYSDNF